MDQRDERNRGSEINHFGRAAAGASAYGVQSAFAELWSRHYRSGICVARQYTSIDADDLVSEAFARIYQRVLAGGGPQGAFRPYLNTTIRNIASTWAALHEVAGTHQ